MGWAAALLGASVLMSRFMGLARDKVISFYFGASPESDIYFAAFVIPDFVNYLLAGAYFSITLIPLLSERFQLAEEDGWNFFSAAVTWVAMAIVLVTTGVEATAPWLAHWAAPGVGPKGWIRLSLFLRIIAPAQVFFLLGSCFNAMLYYRKQFHIPALSPLVYNLCIIGGGIILRSRGMVGFCWGVLTGALLGNFLLPLAAVHWGGGLRFRPRFHHPSLRRFFALAVPLMLGQSIVVLDEQFLRIFGSMAGTGTVSWLNYARRIMLVPVGVVAQAAGVASYPFLAELFAKEDMEAFEQTLNTAIKATVGLLIPISTWMILAAAPTVTLIFQQGRFQAADTLQTSRVLQIFLSVVFCWGIQQIVGRGYYARQDTVTPAVIGSITTVLALPLYYYGARILHAQGVAMASAASLFLYTTFLGRWWRYRFGSAVFRGLGRHVISALAASLPALPAAAFFLKIFKPGNHPVWAAFAGITLSGTVFTLLFLMVSHLFFSHILPRRLVRVLERLLPGS